jgi:hypothetical protein
MEFDLSPVTCRARRRKCASPSLAFLFMDGSAISLVDGRLLLIKGLSDRKQQISRGNDTINEILLQRGINSDWRTGWRALEAAPAN